MLGRVAAGRRFATGLIFLVALLLVPAVINRGPFFFPDTGAYVRGADAAVVKATHHTSLWSDHLLKRFPAVTIRKGRQSAAAVQAAPPPEGPIVLAGRSIYYGGLLYLLSWGGNFAPLVLFQALLAGIVILLTFTRLASPEARLPRLIGVMLLPLYTSVGYFAAFLMPDLFAALAILAAGHILFFWGCDPRWRRGFWLVLLIGALLSHSATLVTIAALTAMFAARLAWPLPHARKIAFVPIVLALLAAILGEAAFSGSVRAAAGFAPVRPPFLTARLVENGPGKTYLDHHCTPEPQFLLCRHRARLPLPSDDFLWSADPRRGLFTLLPPQQQRALVGEQARFVMATWRAYPWEVVRAGLRDFALQVKYIKLFDFNLMPEARDSLSNSLPAPVLARLKPTAAFERRMPVRLIDMLTPPLTILSLAAAGLFLVAPRARNGAPADGRRAFVLWVIVAVFANAAICGALSGPHDRYQARIVWLLPLVAVAVARVPAYFRRHVNSEDIA